MTRAKRAVKARSPTGSGGFAPKTTVFCQEPWLAREIVWPSASFEHMADRGQYKLETRREQDR